MVRKQLNLEDDLDRALSERAARRGVSQSRLVREMLRAGLDAAENRERERREAWAAIGANWARLDAQSPSSATPGPRDWTREDLYAERLDGIGRRRH